MPTFRWTLGLLCAFLGVACAVGADGARVPKLLGERTGVASQLAVLADLKYCEGVYLIAPQNWREDIKPAVIYMQSPQPGTAVLPGSTVAAWKFIRAEKDAKIIEVPDVRGQEFADALKALKALGLKSMSPHKADDEMKQTIIDQYPEPGTQVYVGTSMFLTHQPAPLDPSIADPSSPKP